MKPTIDISRRPIVVVTFHRTLTADDVVEHFREVTHTVRDLGRVGMVVDLSQAPFFSAAMRRLGSSEMRRAYAAVGSQIVGAAHVVDSATIRGMLTAVYWLAPPPFPSTVVADTESAFEWVRARL